MNDMMAHTTPPEPALLLDARQVAAMLKIGVSTLYKLHASGRVPEPVRLGASVRWRRAELVAWTAAGCPARGRWTWKSHSGNSK